MNLELNSLEMAILEDIGRTHAESHPELSLLILKTKVASREYTGVGVYVNFVVEEVEESEDLATSLCLATNASYQLDSLKNPLVFELNLTRKGSPEFLELVSNDSGEWNGLYKHFERIEGQ